MEFLGIRTKSGAIVQPNSGEEMIRKFDFAYSTPGLTTGVVVYTPTVGDILLDAWIEIDTAFNGTTPLADVGQFSGSAQGWYSFSGFGAVDLTQADNNSELGTGILSGSGAALYPHGGGNNPTQPPGALSLATSNVLARANGTILTDVVLTRAVPAKIVSPNPVKLVVSQDGSKGGAATGATQGAGSVYFLTGTPQ